MTRSILAGVFVLAAGAGSSFAAAPDEPAPQPGPSVGARQGGARDNAGCEGCHATIAQSWRGSLHRRSFTDPDFAGAFSHEPRAFCRSCHAPQDDPALGRQITPLAAIGVACVTCHAPRGVSPGTVLAGSDDPGRGPAPHPVQRSASLSAPAFCGGCHAFAFPDDPSLPMQATLAEHAQSPAADTPCVDCHMPRRDALGGQRDHGFSASRDLGMLRAAVHVHATRDDDERVTIVLSPGVLGHAFPTGDMFRRVIVVAQALDGEHARASALEILGRKFQDGHRREVDTRLGANGDYGPRQVVLALPGAAGLRIAWSVSYQRADDARSLDGEPTIFATVELASGTL